MMRLYHVDATIGAVWADIVRMDAECFGSSASALASNRGAWWILKDGDKSAAYAGIVPSARAALGGYLSRSGVLTAYRGHGIQKRLIKARLAYAKLLGWSEIVTDTTNNPASSNSLIACGFKLYSPEKPWGYAHANYWKYVIRHHG